MSIPLSQENKKSLDHQRFQILVNAIHDYAIYMLDKNGIVVSWNSGAQRLKGYTEEEIVGQHFSRFHTAEEQLTGLPVQALKMAELEGHYETEGWRIRKDGTRFWANVVLDPIKENSQLIGFAKITRDITERKTAEEELRRSEQQFRLLVQGVSDYAIYMVDPNGYITSWNKGAERIKGYTKEEITGKHFSCFYPQEDQNNNLPAHALLVARTQGRFEKEGIRVRKDGSTFLAHVIIDPIYDANHEFVGYAKITRDITEKQLASETLKRTELALQQAQKMESIGKLTGGVAHDFNNLLQVISGNLQLLSNEVIGNERAGRRISHALAGVSRGTKLASYLLAFGRRQALEPKVVNIGRSVIAMEDMFQRSLGETIEVETIVAAGLWNTFVDVVQVENALLNLAVNARDAMNGSGKLTVELSNAFLDDAYAKAHAEVTPGQYVLLAVTDTGCGMSPEIIAQAFEPFFSTKPEGKGTGLGLSMVYGFVKQSGGHIKIYSEIGHGTIVKLYLPRSMEKEDIPSVYVNEKVSGGSETILVAEDDEQVAITVIDILRSLGYRVLKAADAVSALAIIDSGLKIDLLFTDVVMPGPLKSTELARKARERLPEIAVLFTSGYTQNAIVHGGRLDAGVDLLSKPYSREALARKIRNVIVNQQQKNKIIVSSAVLSRSIEIVKKQSLKILLVEDEELIRTNTVDMLQFLGHIVFQQSDASGALIALQKSSFDVLITDIGLAGVSGEVIAKKARELYPSIGIIFATGGGEPKSFDNSVLLSKPYDLMALETSLVNFLATKPKI